MTLFGSMGLMSTQSGTSELMVTTLKRPSEDTNFLTAISEMFIGVGCLLFGVELAGTDIPTSKMQRPN
jgi:hypothetical protein